MAASVFSLHGFCGIGSIAKGRMQGSQKRNIETRNLRHENMPGSTDNTEVVLSGIADCQQDMASITRQGQERGFVPGLR
jgi:hypothetical protein